MPDMNNDPNNSSEPTAPPMAAAPPVQTPNGPATPAMQQGMRSPGSDPLAAPPAPPPNPQQAAQAADQVKHYGIGKAFSTLMGDQKPGQLFKSILAGALLGGSASGDGQGGFAGGFARGGAAVMKDDRQQQQVAQAQQQQQFENNMKTQESQRENAKAEREAQAFKTEQELRQANIAHLNIQKLHENILLGSATLDLAEKAASSGKAMMQPYVDAGLPTVFQDKSEKEMHDLWSTNPQAKSYLWDVTGTKVVMDAKGEPTYEKTYSAVDPKGTVQITQGVLDNFKRVKLGEFYPGADRLKVGQPIDAQQMMALQHAYNDLNIKQLTQRKADLDLNKESAEIMRDRAQAAKDLMEANKGKLETKQAQLYAGALDEYNKVGGDFDKLSPKSQVVLAESTGKLIADLSAATRASLQADPTDADGKAKTLMTQIGRLSALVPKSFKPNLPKPGKTGDAVPEDVAQKYLDAFGKNAAQEIQKAGWTIPGVSGPPNTNAPAANPGGPAAATPAQDIERNMNSFGGLK